MAYDAAPAVGGKTAEVTGYAQQFESLKQGRLQYDRKWQFVSDYILPRRDFSVTQRPDQLRPHRVTSSVATNANARMAALVLAYAIDPTRPFLFPNVTRGLAMAGRSTTLDNRGLDYLSGLEWQIYSHMVLPRAQLMLRLGAALLEFCSFGNGILWTGRRRGFGPYYNTRPLQACWWSENEEGVIDTLFFRMQWPLWRVLARWPEAAAAVEAWKHKANGLRDEQMFVPIICAVRPRDGGQHGAVVENKPFSYLVYAEAEGAVLERSGYDSFPYAVLRYNPMPGQAYAEGPGCQVLPDVMVLNHLQQALENGASQRAEPAIGVPARMFGKTLDRRPGAVNPYNPAGLGLLRADQAILKMDFTGDPTEAINVRSGLIQDIELGYFVDWLRLRETGDMTAEEVGERRDMRLRGMSSIVANLEQPLTVLGDRSLEIMDAENQIPPPPPSVSRAEVDWEYAGPLAIAQLRGNVQAVIQLINARALVQKDDPMAAQAVDLEESLRVIAEGLATPSSLMKSRVDVQAMRDAAAQEQQQQRDIAKAALVAKAANDAGGAMGGMAAAASAPAPAPGGPGAGFAPAAPFAEPVV